MKKLFLPVLTALVATGAAMATELNSGKNAVQGFRIGNLTESPCEPTPKDCGVTGSVVCTWSDGSVNHTLYAIDGTVCGDELYEIMP